MVYFLVQLDEKSDRLHFMPMLYPIIPHVLQLQCNNLPHENCKNLPQGGNFTRNTYPPKTHAHKVVTIPSIYTTGILHFPTFQFPVAVGYFWRKVDFRTIM